MNTTSRDHRAESIGNGSVASISSINEPGGRSTPVTSTTMMKPVESSGNLSTMSGRSNSSTNNNPPPSMSAVPYEVRSRTRSGGSAHSGRSNTPVSQYEYSVPSSQAVAAPQASLMAPIGELLTESETARGKRQKQYQEQQQSAQAQSQPQDSKAAAQQSQRPGHNRKRTWSAPAGTVEHLMSTAAAAAAVGGPAMTTRSTAYNTPNKSKKAGDGEAAAASSARVE